jgi:hypothetical protein
MMLDKGTPLDEDPSLLSVMSYNLLAPLYVRPVDERTGQVQDFAAFEWAEPANEVLAWDKRRPRLLQELVSSKADIICLQEVQFETEQSGAEAGQGVHVLPTWLRLEGYETVIPSQGSLEQLAQRNERVLKSRSAIGNAILYRTDRLERCDSIGASTGKSNANAGKSKKKARKGDGDGRGSGQATTRVMICVKGRAGSLLEMDAAAGTGMDKVVIAALHLDATDEEKRVAQLEKCLDLARGHGTRDAVLMGDLNTELHRCCCL